ncbi:MAG: hypothetical protein ACRD08_04615 [Acidimicrobiales bacterium]
MSLRSLVAAFVLWGATLPLAAQQPAGASAWRSILDPPRPATGQGAADSGLAFAPMPPGWHVTTGPGAVLFDARNRADGRFVVEAEMFLFPGTGQEGYGVFVGGADLEGGQPGYTAFVVRRDGSAAVVQRRAGADTLLAPWTRDEAVVAHPGDGTAKNVLRIVADPATVTFLANDRELVKLPRAALRLDGVVGLRVGSALDVHTSRLDVTYRLAPARP